MKLMKALVVMALVLFMAAPAFAEFKLNGYYRLQGTYAEIDGASDDDYKTITQRLRTMLTYSLNENVGFVYFLENDLDWGNNGDLGVDDKNIETKNAYLYINGDGYSAKLGAQGYSDIFSGLLFSNDLMAATASFKLGAADLGLIYGKFEEGVANVDDDTDFYGATVAFAATEAVKLTGAVYVVDADAVTTPESGSLVYNSTINDFDLKITNEKTTEAYTNVYYGARVDAKVADNVDVSAFGLIADMEDGSTYALDASAKFKLANGSIMLEGLYMPDETDGDVFQYPDAALDKGSEFFYSGMPFMFMLRDISATNNGRNEGKFDDNLADGLTLLMGYGQFDFGGIYAGAGVAWAEGDTRDIGTEVLVKVGKKFFGNVDVSVRAAMWAGGDDIASTKADESADETKVIGMVNVGF